MNQKQFKKGLYENPRMAFWGLRFSDPEIEKAYGISIRKERMQALRFFAGFGGLLFISMILVDYFSLGNTPGFQVLMAGRIVAGMTCLLAVFLIPRLKSDIAIDTAMLTAVIAVACVLCLVPFFRYEEARIHQLIVIVMLIIFYSFLPIRLTFLLSTGIFMTIFLLCVMIFGLKSDATDILGIVILITMANGVGFYTTRKTIRLSKFNYWKIILLDNEIRKREQMSKELENAHHKAESSHQQLHDAIDNISEGFVLYDRDGKVLVCNQKFKNYYRYGDKEVYRGVHYSTLEKFDRERNILSEDTPEHDKEKFLSRYRTQFTPQVDIIIKLSDGRWLQVRDRLTQVGNIVSLQADITALKEAEAKIRHIANHDSLTGLPSLHLCMDRLSMAISKVERDNSKVAVFFIDLDGFKAVNDNHGHAAGDFVLKTIAERFKGLVRKSDTISRIGGDEFLAVSSFPKACRNDDLPRRLIKAASASIPWKGVSLYVGASIGVAFYPDHGDSMKAVIQQADQAMYQAKAGGKNDYVIAGKPD